MANSWSQYDEPTVKRNANAGPQRPFTAPQPEMQSEPPRLSLRDRAVGAARNAGSLVAGEKAAAMGATAANQLDKMSGLRRFATNFITNAKSTPLTKWAAKGSGAYDLYKGGQALAGGDYDAAKSHFTDSAVAGASVLPQLNPVLRAGATGYTIGTNIHRSLSDNANDAIGSAINKGLNLFGLGQEDTSAYDRMKALTKAQMTQPQAAQPQAAPAEPKPLTPADDKTIVGTGENGYVAIPPKPGQNIQTDTYTNVPSQQDTFAASKGNVSTIQTGGAENYARQLATIQGLREGLGPQGGQVSVIANPDKKAPPSALETVQNALNGMSGKLNAGGLAAIVEAQKADQTAATQRESIAQRDRENVAQAAAKNTGPSFRDLLEAKKFQYQTGRDKLQDALALEGNDRNNRVAGANLASTAQNIEKGREDLTTKQFEALFRKKDEKDADVADTETISRFRSELEQAIKTLANSGDKADVARFGIQYKKADGSLGLRAREWDELTGTDKNELVRGFKFSDHVKKYATDGDKGGNFGEYMRGRKDAQGRIVFGAGGKTRAIADEATLNSDGTTWNPLAALDPFDKRSFGLGEKHNRTEGFVK